MVILVAGRSSPNSGVAFWVPCPCSSTCRSFGFEVWGLRFVVWGLVFGFEFWGLGFGISSSSLFFSSQTFKFFPVCSEAVRGGGTVAEGEKIVFFDCLDLYHKSPDSGKLQYK